MDTHISANLGLAVVLSTRLNVCYRQSPGLFLRIQLWICMKNCLCSVAHLYTDIEEYLLRVVRLGYVALDPISWILVCMCVYIIKYI